METENQIFATLAIAMSDDILHTFRRCSNCGVYYTPDQNDGPLCSHACGERYERCSVCGRYFKRGDGVEDALCSEECTRVYTIASGDKTAYVLTEETA